MKRIPIVFSILVAGSPALSALGCGHAETGIGLDTTSEALQATDPSGTDTAADGGKQDTSGTTESDTTDSASDATDETDRPGSDIVWPDEKYLSVDQVYNWVTAKNPDMLLINVVDEEYYNLGHIEGSLKIPWDTLEGSLDQVPSSRHIVLYCRRGVRSESAYETLLAHDYSMVWVMEGGIEAWIAKGYPTIVD